MSNLLVTGGAGFIGSHVAEELSNRDYRVTVLGDLSGGYVENLVPELKFVRGNINDMVLVNSLFYPIHFDYVYHLEA